MNTLYYLIQNTLPVAIPLLLVALGGMFSENSGVINIALEGIMLFGAFFGCLAVLFMQNSQMNVQLILIIAMIIAAISGIVYSMLLAWASINMKADQTITGTALNMLIPAAILLFSKMKFNSDGITTSVSFYIKEIPVLGKIPVIGDLFFKNTYITVYIGLLLLIISTIVFYMTRFGLRLRACGEHPHAADSVGISVYLMRYMGVGISGFLGGIGGFFYSVGVMDGNVNGHTGVAGFGFLALAVMIFGQWRPIKIFFASLFFAFLRTLAYSVALIPFLSNLGINQTFYKMLPYIATMIALMFTSKRSRAPKAEGIPFTKSR
ncbi:MULTISPECIES: ABC transporter permease [Clostridium]|uniref:Branched-chain amino acid transport system / permease component n=2 Tax=Clostridium TaxID=1485 RepID=A0A151AKN2_9CLOT|nr:MULTISPECIES: ABC transporter permease [Clostridium]KYH28090.1 branched-chain amino acid transport system / permease component [Clostridium colicanis DSM 13634]MBE6043037.1 ABC transporter permease [Clostridium thermopalmarium]PRR71564.1 Branched-chain amino acid transport system / permease component [Clostridium thermopalmarium DSM 5974]PVZ20971.1 simple sugar transport system permease protein [Clostridium thermopalmarium DSM 5974]